MCKFRISEVAELMDLSVSGMVYLEKKGAVTSLREENGYRYYSAGTVSKLGLLRSFERVGFSLNEALQLLRSEPDAVRTALRRKGAELQRQLIALERITDAMEIATPKKETIEETQMPAFSFFHYWEKYCDPDNMSKAERDAMRAVDTSWLGALPAVSYCDKLLLEDNAVIDVREGMIVKTDEAKEEGLVMNHVVEHFPAQPCLHLYTEGDNGALLEKLSAYATSAGLRLCSPVMALVRYMEIDGEELHAVLREVYAPVLPRE